MVAVAFNNYGHKGMIMHFGNAGLQYIHHKSMKYILEDTRIMRNCSDEVFLLNDFTQEMCEMNMGRLYDYVLAHGKRIK